MARRGIEPWSFVLALALAAPPWPAAAALFASEVPAGKIAGVESLGLERGDIPISTETKIAYLVNPALNRADELAVALRRGDGPTSARGSWTALPCPDEAVRALTAPGRPGNIAAYDAVVDVADQFFKYTFKRLPDTERSLHRIVQEVNRTDFPLVVVDAVPRLVGPPGSRGEEIETVVTVRLFTVHVEGDRDVDLRWVTRCELCFEDSASGRAPWYPGLDPVAAMSASLVDALRGKIALSFTHSPALRRPSGTIEEPRQELIGRSIAEVSSPREPARPPKEEAAPASLTPQLGTKS